MKGNKSYSPTPKDSKANKKIYGILKGKEGISKPTYREWILNREGWKRLGAFFAGLALFGYVVDMAREAERQRHSVDAQTLFQQGVRPVEMGSQYTKGDEVTECHIKDEQDIAWGQSHLKGTERRE